VLFCVVVVPLPPGTNPPANYNNNNNNNNNNTNIAQLIKLLGYGIEERRILV
jgi:hypothetical protein